MESESEKGGADVPGVHRATIVGEEKVIDRLRQKLRPIITLAKGTQAGQLTLCLVVKVLKSLPVLL